MNHGNLRTEDPKFATLDEVRFEVVQTLQAVRGLVDILSTAAAVIAEKIVEEVGKPDPS